MSTPASEFLTRLQSRHSLACGKWRLANKLGLESRDYYLGYMKAIDDVFNEAKRLLGDGRDSH